MHTYTHFAYRSSYANLRFAALPTLFFLLGLLNGAWVSRIPALCAHLHISYATLAGVLLFGGLGGMMSHYVAARLVAAFGSRKAAFHAGLGMCLGLLVIGLAPSVPLLMTAVFMLGLASGSFGVAINDIGAAHENKAGKSKMASLYALCCAGSLTGVFSGGVIAGLNIAPSAHFLGISLVSALMCCASCVALEPDRRQGPRNAATAGKVMWLPRGALLPLGALGFCGAMAQNSIAEWSGVFLKEHFRVSDSIAPMALSAFSIMMLIFRLLGDGWKDKYGAGKLISIGGVVAALGLSSAVLAPHAYVALVGFALAGTGLSLLFPFIYSAAAKQGMAGITSIAGMCNIGILAGPLAMGAAADILGMQGAIGLLGVLSAVIAVLAAKSSLLKREV